MATLGVSASQKGCHCALSSLPLSVQPPGFPVCSQGLLHPGWGKTPLGQVGKPRPEGEGVPCGSSEVAGIRAESGQGKDEGQTPEIHIVILSFLTARAQEGRGLSCAFPPTLPSPSTPPGTRRPVPEG